ncbi:hypothetical protein ACFPIJ_53760 [Dactylosporangium cerinum]|uniref:Uncharacterized protein n=1 Tax=Dactylosporangium cerinum TaxID=1434730 RepID=A0ABV9WFV6_9ACTN
MARMTFQTLGVILLLLGLGGATSDSDDGTTIQLLRDLAYVGVGVAFMIAAVASAIAEQRRTAPPVAAHPATNPATYPATYPATWTPPQQYPAQPQQAPGAQPPWGPAPT